MHSRTESGPRQSVLAEPLARSELPLPLRRAGKVRDVYDLGDALLMVATDRISAFDVVMPEPVPRKGEVLNLLSAWWFQRTADIIANHMISVDPDAIAERYPALAGSRAVWARRSMLVQRLEPFPVECVVRGYIAGSAWQEYQRTGTLAGEPLPAGLREASPLETPLFSPATKAEEGHDDNITFERMASLVGRAVAEQLREASFRLYQRGREIAHGSGIIIADTKFEFGRDASGAVHVIDEMLTPDSSRFWPAESYRAGAVQPSLDKQPLRDYLHALAREGRWNKQAPAPELPEAVIRATSERYRAVFQRLTGHTLEQFPLSSLRSA
jgi:phosphoribosylaminoimidazole-succinocarboxamide synthase